MNDSQNAGNEKNNNIHGLFVVLVVLIVVAVFIQGIYIHRLMKQVKLLSDKQAQAEFVENTKPPVFVNQKIKTDSFVTKTSPGNKN